MSTETNDTVEGTVVGHTWEDESDVYIGRNQTQGSMNEVPVGERGWLGNPYPEEQYGRERCIALFKQDFTERLESDPDFREAVKELSGKTLGCWCRRTHHDEPACHGDVIAEYADKLAEGEFE